MTDNFELVDETLKVESVSTSEIVLKFVFVLVISAKPQLLSHGPKATSVPRKFGVTLANAVEFSIVYMHGPFTDYYGITYD